MIREENVINIITWNEKIMQKNFCGYATVLFDEFCFFYFPERKISNDFFLKKNN